MEKSYHSDNLKDTKKFAEQVANWIRKKEFKQQALVVALVGDLGAGKTTFVQHLGKVLGVEEKILSPTFVILKKFSPKESSFNTLYHIDCYRTEKPEELLKLNFEEIISDPNNLVIIEWADKIKSILPNHYLKLNFEVTGKGKRKIKTEII